MPDLGAGKIGGKFGGQITVGDDNSVGAKGAEVEMNLTVMQGLNTEVTRLDNPFSGTKK